VSEVVRDDRRIEPRVLEAEVPAESVERRTRMRRVEPDGHGATVDRGSDAERESRARLLARGRTGAEDRQRVAHGVVPIAPHDDIGRRA